MSNEHIKKALHETLKEFTELHDQENEHQRQAWEVRKKKFKVYLKAHSLAALCDDIPPNSLIAKITRQIENTGLTGAVRNIMAGNGDWLSVAQLREQLIRFRIDLARYKNPASSIHTILGRLVESGDLEQKIDPKTNKPIFRQIPPDFLTTYPEVTADAVADFLVQPQRRKGGRKKLGQKKGKLIESKSVGGAEAPLLTEGSLKVN